MRKIGISKQQSVSQNLLSKPLYRHIADDLIDGIARGRYPVGTSLPSEVDLAARLGVSRGSIRGALQILANSGLIARERRLGTTVLRKSPHTGYVQQLTGLNDALGFGADTLMRIDEVRDVAQPDECAFEGESSPTGFWLQVTGIRHLPSDPAPTTWACLYINGIYSGIRPHLAGEIGSLYKLIERAYDIRVSRLKHRITAIAVEGEAALALGLLPGSPALAVDAWLYSERGTLVEFVRSIHHPDRFSIELMAQSQD